MRKFYPYVIALALMAGSAIYGSAQTTYSRPLANAFLDDRDHERWEEGRARAQELGYQDGLHDGRSDGDHHHEFQPTHGGSYRHGDRGYDSHFGDKGRYQHEYREAYERGYREGYHREHEQERREERHEDRGSW